MRLIPLALLALALPGCMRASDKGDTGRSYLTDTADAGGDADEGRDTADSNADDTSEDTAGDTANPPCDDATPVTLYLSPDDSNSMASPVLARLAVLDSWGPFADVPLRTWEFMNYYGFAYPEPEPGHLAVTTQLVATDTPDTYELQVGIRAPTVTTDERRPMNLIFSVDTSGSMTGAPLQRAAQIGRAVAAQLHEGDIVSLVTWSTDQTTVLRDHAVTGPDDTTLRDAFDGLVASGSTNFTGGLTAAYDIASADHDPARARRVILISDGGANAGVTDLDLIAAQAGDAQSDGVYLVGIGVGGTTTYNPALMDVVTDAGKGASLFIGSSDEATTVLSDRFEEVFDIAARSVQLKLELPPGFSIQHFSGEGYSTDPTEVPPQNLAPNDTMVFYNTVVTCAPELLTDETTITATATWLDPVTFEAHADSTTATFAAMLAEDPALLAKGRAVYTYAEALRVHQQGGGTPSIEDALATVSLAEARNPGDRDLAEIRAVLEAL